MLLELDSADWSRYRHAYGDASDVPTLLSKLRAASATEWDAANTELMNAVMHKGDVYTSTYAVATEVVWQSERTMRATPNDTFDAVLIDRFSVSSMPLEYDFEFDDDQLHQQIVSLAASSGHEIVERQMRSLFGTTPCVKCHSHLFLSARTIE